MRNVCQTEGDTTAFIIADLEPAYHEAARHLFYSPTPAGFAKHYPTDTPHLDRIYYNFERFAEEMILQAARVRPAPWDQSLEAFLQLIEGEGIDWWLGGSAALAVRGLKVLPCDLDLITDEASALKLGELLIDYLVEPVLFSDDWVADWFGRAFLHARLEWVGGINERADQPTPGDFGPTAAAQLETVTWRGHPIRVPPLELQLQVCQQRNLLERVEMIKQLLETG